MSNSNPKPGVYRKGLEVRVADTAAEAVTLAWNGYVLQTAELVAEVYDRPALQEQAKSLGIKANQSNKDLAEAIASAQAEGEGVAHGASGLNAPDLGVGTPAADPTVSGTPSL
jgi:hypothetical protein